MIERTAHSEEPIVFCVSANPAIDKRLTVPRLVPGRTHRASSVQPAPGGKATHVATVLRTLGARPVWLGFAGGSGGVDLLRGLHGLNIEVCSVTTRGETRVNLEIIDDTGTVTEILEPGATISESELAEFEQKCVAAFEQNGPMKVAIFSGSLPQSVPEHLYGSLIRLARRARCISFLDTNGEALRGGLAANPDFVKPNREEAETITGLAIKNRLDAATAGRRFMELGALSVAISLGEDGIVWIPGNDAAVYVGSSPKVSVRSTVGCGDSTVAAFALARVQELSAEDTLRLAVACGAANCLADIPGRLRAAAVEELKSEVRIERLL
jgi:1-phosphofructokinase family hexose kinase